MGIHFKKTVALILIGLMLVGSMPLSGAYAQTLTEQELEWVPGSEVVISDMMKTGAELNPEAAAYGSLKDVTVEGQTFTKALQFKTSVQPQSTYLFQYVIPIEARIEKNDVLLATFYARTVSSSHETAEGTASIVMERRGTWEKSINESMSIPSQWKKYLIPIKSALLMEENSPQLTFRLGYKPQVVEIADLKVVNYKSLVAFEDLPSTPVYYEGMEEDAPWRAEADTRIEQYRKGDLEIAIKDKAGRAVAGADVQVEMTKHDFKFGTAVNSSMIFGTDQNSAIYKEKLKENFNAVVMENEMKWPWWENDKSRAVKLYNWLGENDFAVRGHTLLWDNTSRLPGDIGGLLNNPEQLNKRIKDHINEIAGYFRGRVFDWDVVNEPVLNSMIRSVYGDQIAAEWLKQAKEADPEAKLYVNETQILGVDAPVIGNFSNFLQSLKDNGAPVDGVGIQAHFGSTPVSPMAFYNQITHFTQYADEIAITEFDMNSSREDIQGQFTHDLLLSVFSHPKVNSFTMWGFWDGAHWQSNAPLYRNDWTLKPSGEQWRKLIYDTWWTRDGGSTDSEGLYRTRGFYGDYDITVTYNGTSQTGHVSLVKGQDNKVVIVLGQPSASEPEEPFLPLPLPHQTADITAPVWPYGETFDTSGVSPTSVTLSWPEAYDNAGLAGYVIYKDGNLLEQVPANVTSYDVTNLSPSKAYSFNIVAVDNAGNRSVPSPQLKVGTVSGLDGTIPGWNKGSALTVDELAQSTALLGWPAAADNVGVKGYRIYVNGKIAGDTEQLSYKLSGLTENTQYTVRVEAKDDDGNLSLGGPIVTFKTLPAEDTLAPVWSQPELISSEVNSSSLNLSWSPAQDATGVSAYRIYKGNEELVTLPATTSSFRVTGLSEDNEYSFSVEAVDNYNNWTVAGPQLTVRTAASQDLEPPGWPATRMLTYASLNDHNVTLNWTPAGDNIGVAAYRLYKNDALIMEVSGNERSYRITGLEANRSYTFRVEAGDAAGNWTAGGPSLTLTTAEGLVRMQQKIYPSMDAFIQAPAVYGGEGTNHNLNYLRFKNAAGLSGLEQTKNTGNNRRVFMQFPLNSVTGSVYEASLHLYVYSVQAANTDIGMDLYRVGDAWTETGLKWINQPVEGVKLGSTVIRNNNYWTQFPVTDYVISETNGDGSVSFKLQDDLWVDQNVDIYSREASGVNEVFRPYLLVSTESEITDTAPPVWTEETLEISDIKPHAVKLSWKGASDNSGINGYSIYQDGEYVASVGADVYSYEPSGLTPSTTYQFQVRARDAIQESVSSPSAGITTAPADLKEPVWPPASSLKAIEASRFEVELQWTPAEDEYGVAEYIIYNGNIPITAVSGTELGHRVSGLSTNTEYRFTIAAKDAAGNETQGPNLTVSTAMPDKSLPVWPADAGLVSSGSTRSGVGLTWGDALDDTGVARYQIYRADILVADIASEIKSYFVTGLTPDTAYPFTIIAIDAAGNASQPLELAEVRTLKHDTITPQWTTGSRIIARIDTGKVHLHWDAAIDNVSINQYNIYENGVLAAQIDGKLTSFTLPEATDTAAVYKIDAVDSAGNGSVLGPRTDDPVIPVPMDTTPPGWSLDSALTAEQITQTSVKLSWSAAVDRMGVTGYKLLMNGNEVAATEANTQVINGLTAGTVYEFKVEASDAAGNWSSTGPGLKVRTLDAAISDSGSGTNPGSGSGSPVIQAQKEGMQIDIVEGKVRITVPTSGLTVNNGLVKVVLDKETLVKAFSKMLDGKPGGVSVKIPKMAGATAYSIDIPVYNLTKNGPSGSLELITEFGSILLPGNLLSNNLLTKEQEIITVSIAMAKVTPGSANMAKVGSVLDLDISSGGYSIENKGAEVTVAIPYEPAADERGNTEYLSVWYIDYNGKPHPVPSGRYHAAAGEMRFKTKHFGKHAVVFNKKTFNDLTTVKWAQQAIEVLASKGIINGVSDHAFNPKAAITRADFITLLVETLGLTAEADGAFTDVKEGYYYEAVNTAHKLGIVEGKGNSLFYPKEQMNRQDMIVMISRALALTAKTVPVSPKAELSAYSDHEQVAAYAINGIAVMVDAGLIQGNEGKLEPLRYSTRAEAATLMYRLFNYVNEEQ